MKLNLTAASLIIQCEPAWKIETEQQVLGTVFRIGQTKTVTYVLLVGKKIKIELLKLKMTTSDNISNGQTTSSKMASQFSELFEQRGLIRLNFDLEPDNKNIMRGKSEEGVRNYRIKKRQNLIAEIAAQLDSMPTKLKKAHAQTAIQKLEAEIKGLEGGARVGEVKEK